MSKTGGILASVADFARHPPPTEENDMHNATYHVYYAPDGCDDCYVGEAASLDEARALMESGQKGLERSLWDTARAAGHCAGLVAPETEHEDDEPLEWGGPEGYHCIVAVRDPA